MADVISARFATRREAELAVEHLVQDHKLDRNAIAIQAAGPENTAGTRPAGGDVESGQPGVEKHGEPALTGEIEIRVECPQGQRDMVEAVLREAGSKGIPGH
jgi:hypothetical protein